MYRHKSYAESLAKELADPEYAREFLLGLMEVIDGEEGVTLEHALRRTILGMGVAEYCVRAKKSKQYVNNFLKAKRATKPETLNMLLKPFKLRVRLVAERAS
jgi:hypothetical protein